MKKTRTSARNPKGNCQIERYNQTLVRMIKSYLTGEQSTWDEHFGSIAGAYRATPHEATGFSPNMTATGQEVRLPADIVYQVTQANQTNNCAGVVNELRNRLVRAHEIARSHLQARAKTIKIAYDRKSTLHAYSVGDIVWYLNESWGLFEAKTNIIMMDPC